MALRIARRESDAQLPAYRERRSSWQPRWGRDVLVRITTDDGLEGIGGTAPGPAQPLIEAHFANLLIGQDPFDVERLWDQMFRASCHTAARACRSWRSARWTSPCGILIGKAKERARLAASSASRTKRRPSPSIARATMSRNTTKLGFTRFKLAMPHGPDGRLGGHEGEYRARSSGRATSSGRTRDIVLDCYMAWNVEYTLRMARAAGAVPRPLDRGVPAAGRL